MFTWSRAKEVTWPTWPATCYSDKAAMIMKRQLFIIRHGKSSWENEGLDDIDRPLSDRGIRNAEDDGRQAQGYGPGAEADLYQSGQQGTEYCPDYEQGIWGLDPSLVQIHDELYMAYLKEISRVVEQAPDDTASLAIFGHNPSFTMYANHFLKVPLDNLPTAGVVVLTLESDSWKRIDRKQVSATYVDFPKR